MGEALTPLRPHRKENKEGEGNRMGEEVTLFLLSPTAQRAPARTGA